MTQVVDKGTTATVLGSIPSPSAEGDNVTFTATVSTVTGVGLQSGTVEFFNNGVSLGTSTLSGGQAVMSTAALLAGNHTMTAVYSGDGNFTGSTSPALTHNVLRRTTTVVTSNRVPTANLGQSVTFTATVRPVTGTGIPTGTVQFSIDGVTAPALLTLNAQGRATYTTSTLSAGSHSVVATYARSAVFEGSTSATFTQVVNQATTTTVVTSSTNPSVFGQNVTFTARVTPGAATGTVQFSIDGAAAGGPVALDATGRARITVGTMGVGPHAVTAVYGGSVNYFGSTSAAFNQTVNKSNSRTVVTTSLTPAPVGSTVSFTVTVTPRNGGAGVPQGNVDLSINGVSRGQVALNASGQAVYPISGLAIGNYSVTAVYLGDGNFNASTGNTLTQRIR